MLRETVFEAGGILTIALGCLLVIGLVWSDAGWLYAEVYLGGAAAICLGTFFFHVGRDARAYRLRLLRYGEESREGKPSGEPPI